MYKLKKLQKGGIKQNPPKVYNDINEYRKAAQSYNDSLSLYNKGEKAYQKYLTTNRYYNIPTSSTRIESNPVVYEGDRPARIQPIMSHRYWYNHNPDVIAGTDLPSNTVPTSTDRYKKPIQPVVYQKPFTHPIQKLNRLNLIGLPLGFSKINMQGQPISIPIPKQQGNPFYGPGNTVIGYVDNQRKFTPAQQYTGAANNPNNLKDKQLLENLDQLKQYVSKFDNYSFKKGGTFRKQLLQQNNPIVDETRVNTLMPVTEEQIMANRKKTYDYIRPSDYMDLPNYARWFTRTKRSEFDDPRSEEAFRLYLNLENNPKYFSKSEYEPTINKNPNTKFYYKVDPQLEQEIFNSYKDKVKLNEIYKTDESEVISQLDKSNPGYFVENGKEYIANVPRDRNMIIGRAMNSNARALGRFVVSKGKDKKGEYISYSDQYDFPDWIQHELNGKPYNIYGRIYYPKNTLKPVKK